MISFQRVDGTLSVGSFFFFSSCYFDSFFGVLFSKERLRFDALRMVQERVAEEANFWLKPQEFG